jgi:hypothetical protein
VSGWILGWLRSITSTDALPAARSLRLALALVPVAIALVCALGAAQPASGRPATGVLRSAIENVTQATAYRYGARDNEGTSLDTLKVIRNPKGGYLGVYHALRQGIFVVKLARSTDLLTWVRVADLDVHASQPTLAATPGGGFVLGEERDSGCTGTGPGGNCLAFRHYPSLAGLLAGAADRTFQAPRSLSKCAEGTPNIYSVRIKRNIRHSTIKVGFHYFRDCQVDRQAGGVLRNFSSWSARVDGRANRVLEAFHPDGNIGDRDFARIPGGRFSIHEVQFRRHDFGSWRVFLYDRIARKAQQLAIKTHGGSSSFANPTFTVLRSPRGRPALLVTLFLPSQGAARTEGGELVYYRELRGRAARLLAG